jgi:Outer membrane lipoprotein carrier protein LolA-like
MISGNNSNSISKVNHAGKERAVQSTRLFFVCLLMLYTGWAATPAYSEEPEKDAPAWTINELMHGLAQVKKSRATFVERKFISILKTPLEYSGTLIYIAPGHLEKFTLLPKPESMVLDQNNLVVQSGEAHQKRTLSLQDYPAIWAFVESFRSTLSGDIATLNRFYHVTLEGHPKQWLLILRPVDDKMKSLVSEIRISGSLEQISTIETRESGGDHSVMSISKDDS